MYTKREAAQALGIDRNTLNKWCGICGVAASDDPRDKRVRLLSADDLRTIRERYADRHAIASIPSAYRPRISDATDVDRDANHVSDSAQQRVAELEALLYAARLRLPEASGEPPHPQQAAHPPARTAAYSTPLPRPATRQIQRHPATHDASIVTVEGARITRPLRRERPVRLPEEPKRPPLPAGLVGVETFANSHMLPRSTAKNAVQSGRLRAERGDYQEGSSVILNVLTATGQAQAHRIWMQRFGDPCRYCGWTSYAAADVLPAPTSAEPETLAVLAGESVSYS